MTNVEIRREKEDYINHRSSNNSKTYCGRLKLFGILGKLPIPLPAALDRPDEINTDFCNAYLIVLLKLEFVSTSIFFTVSENTIYKYILGIKSRSVGASGISIGMLYNIT